MLTGPQETVRTARGLRKSMSLPEVLLWQHLRKRPAGLKFRRQHPAGPYIIDFFCSAAKLAVEIDGVAHEIHSQLRHDAERDSFLSDNGVMTLRLPASYILADLPSAVQHIVCAANQRFLPNHPSTALCAVPLPVPGRI